jgi:hypothetical protein
MHDASWHDLQNQEPTKLLRGALAFVSRRKLLHQIPRSDRAATGRCIVDIASSRSQSAAKNKMDSVARRLIDRNCFVLARIG